MIQNEIQKTEQKRQLWNADKCFLMIDSYSNTEVNPLFESIDNNLYSRLNVQAKRASKNYQTKRVDTNYITKLTKGKLVRWG